MLSIESHSVHRGFNARNNSAVSLQTALQIERSGLSLEATGPCKTSVQNTHDSAIKAIYHKNRKTISTMKTITVQNVFSNVLIRMSAQIGIWIVYTCT